jgi:hypothetical protein
VLHRSVHARVFYSLVRTSCCARGRRESKCSLELHTVDVDINIRQTNADRNTINPFSHPGRFGRVHRLCGLALLVWLVVGVSDISMNWLNKRTFAYDVVLGVLGIVTTASAAYEFNVVTHQRDKIALLRGQTHSQVSAAVHCLLRFSDIAFVFANVCLHGQCAALAVTLPLVLPACVHILL